MEPLSIIAPILVALFISFVTTYIRAKDPPKTPLDREHLSIHVENFMVSIMVLGVMYMISSFDILSGEGFLSALGFSYIGITGLRYLLPEAPPKE